jgi:hypothetical protein
MRAAATTWTNCVAESVRDVVGIPVIWSATPATASTITAIDARRGLEKLVAIISRIIAVCDKRPGTSIGYKEAERTP